MTRQEIDAAVEARKELGALTIAAIFTGLAGVIAVCLAVTVIAIVSSR